MKFLCKIKHSKLSFVSFCILTSILIFFTCGKEAPAKTPSVPDEEVIITGPRGIVAHKAAIAIGQSMLSQAQAKTTKVTEGVFLIEGLGISNCTVIEGKDGVIVVDTGDHVEEGRDRLKEIAKFTDKPVSAIIYSHWHYVNGTTALIPEGKKIPIIAHKKLAYNKANSVGLLGPIVLRRAAFQLGMYLPKEGPDAAPFGSIELKAIEGGYVPPTVTVSNGEKLEIDGVKMQFFTDYRSDTDCSLIVYLPELDTVINNHAFPIFPNLYSLRGGSFRNPITWIQGIDLMIDLNPEYLIVTHGAPTTGKEAVRTRLTNYRDCMQYLYQQAIRGINKGLTPDELVSFVKLPPHLAQEPFLQQIYVKADAVIRQMYCGLIGWFDGESVNIEKMSPMEESEKIVAGFGGRDKVLLTAKQALENKEYNWSAKLSTYLITVNPEDKEAKQLKADALRRLGQLSIASNNRSWYITQARVLEGKIDLTKPPGAFLTKKQVIAAPQYFIKALTVKLDPEKSQETVKTLGVNFSDSGKKVSLQVRKGVAIYKDAYPKEGVDIEINLTSETWAKIIFKELGFPKALETNEVKVTKGDVGGFVGFMGMFDQG
jgi:alkyl sulfatase BDS1-like metallo-beta-lactamase superfamily hydrolase